MNDLSQTITPKSNQLNADDLLTGPRTIRVTRVSVESSDQPVSIGFEGDDGKPYKPGKSMRRVLCKCWGTNGDSYVGREMTLYCDDSVKWAGQAVGGVRISHLSHIAEPVTLALTETKGKRKMFTVQRLTPAVAKPTVSHWCSEASVKAIETLVGLLNIQPDEVQSWLTRANVSKLAELDETRAEKIITFLNSKLPK